MCFSYITMCLFKCTLSYDSFALLLFRVDEGRSLARASIHCSAVYVSHGILTKHCTNWCSVVMKVSP